MEELGGNQLERKVEVVMLVGSKQQGEEDQLER
jgi:hypothetical protein